MTVTVPQKAVAGEKGGKKSSGKGKKESKGKSSEKKEKSPSVEAKREALKRTDTYTAPSTSKEKKGGKKKKQKTIEFEVSLTIPAEPQGPYCFLPDRLTIQKLITRACNLKDKDIEPIPFTETRPWLLQDKMNMDMEIAQVHRTDFKDKIHEWFYNLHVSEMNKKNLEKE